jgi:chaperonin GroES
MAIKPIGQRVLLKRVEAETVSAGGIVLVDSAQEKPQEALVIALGTGGKNEDGSAFEFSVSVNDKVLIAKYGGTDVKIDGEDHLIMSESDILGIIN